MTSNEILKKLPPYVVDNSDNYYHLTFYKDSKNNITAMYEDGTFKSDLLETKSDNLEILLTELNNKLIEGLENTDFYLPKGWEGL